MKSEQERQEAPATEAPRPKQFDSRHLDRLETAMSQFRYWQRANLSDFPEAYRLSQQEAYRVLVMRGAEELAEAMRKWGEE